MSSPQTTPEGQRRTVLALAGAVLALALVGLAVLLLRAGSGGDDRLATPTAEPTSTSPAPSPEPTPEPSPEPSPPPVAPAGWDVATAFLSPEAASDAELPGWSVDEGTEPEPGPLLDPCGDGDFPLSEAVAASDERAMSSSSPEREAGGSHLQQEVFRYEAEQDAAAALSTYLDRVQQCPRQPVEDGDLGHEVERTVVPEASGQDRLLVRERACNPGCTDNFTTYALVVHADDGLSVLRYAIGEDGDPGENAPALLDAAADALQAAVRG